MESDGRKSQDVSLGGSSSLKYTEEPFFPSCLESKERKCVLDLNSQYFTSSYMKLKDFLSELLDLLHAGLCPPDVLLQHLIQLSLLLLSVLSAPPISFSFSALPPFSLPPIFSSSSSSFCCRTSLFQCKTLFESFVRDSEWCPKAQYVKQIN